MSTNTYTQTSCLARGAPLRVGRGLNAAAVHRYMHVRECAGACTHARTHAHTHTHTHTPPHTPSSCRPPRGKDRGVRPQRPPSIQAAMATRTHPKPRVPQRVAAPRRGPREGRRALDPAPARMGASGAVMKPMAQLNRAPQHRAPLIAMRSSAVRARMRAIGFESLSAAKAGFRAKNSWREAILGLPCPTMSMTTLRRLVWPCLVASAVRHARGCTHIRLFVLRARARICGVSGASRARSAAHVSIENAYTAFYICM